MKNQGKLWALAVVVAFALASIFAPHAAAQNDGTITGKILDVEAKPWVELGIQAVSDQGAKSDTKTDKDGNFTIRNLRSGIYQVNIILPAPNQPFVVRVSVQSGGEPAKVNLNFKEEQAKQLAAQGAEAIAARKKQEEDKQKFQGMKEHFDAGVVLLDQVKMAKADLAKAKPDQRDAGKQQVLDLSGKAVTELEAAKTAAPEKDSNLHLIYARLGDAYDGAGRPDDAIGAYKQAIELKPTAAYYNNLGGVYGRTGKVEDAMAAYQKSADLDPANAAQAWRNCGITLYNANRLGDAIEPLQKSAELDPKSAQTWYLLGASLVYKMTTKKVGDREEVILAPGTVEAYQKAEELDPSGPWGAQAKEGLEQLKALAPGIDTKVNARKKKS
jgi:tetratricopeptide (TPR) repeat protein